MPNWEDEPNPLGPPTGTSPTPLDNANLQALEDRAVTRAGAYTDSRVAAGQTITGGDAVGTMGRASTTLAPNLSHVYIITTAPGVTAANGNGTTDDTSIVTAAVTAAAAAGGGIVVIPPMNPLSSSGTRAMWRFQRVSVNGANKVRVSGYGAQAQYVSNSAGGSMFKGDNSTAAAGTVNVTGFALVGLEIVGTGSENALSQSVVEIDRGADITIRDVTATLWNGAVFFLLDAARLRIEDTTLDKCSFGGANPINISVQNSANGNTVLTESLLIRGNIVTNCPTAPVAVSFGSPALQPMALLRQVGNPTGGSAPIAYTFNGTVYTSAGIPANATAAQAQTSIQNGGLGPAVACYGGPLGQTWSGSTPPAPPILIVFPNGQLSGLSAGTGLTGGTAPQLLFGFMPLKVVVTGNPCLETTAWCSVVFEMGGSGTAAAGVLQYDLLVSSNHLHCSGANSGACYGLAFTNDNGAPAARGDLFRWVCVANNKIYSNRYGIFSAASDIEFVGNIIRCAGLAYKCQPPTGGSANPVSHVHIRGGEIHLTASNSTDQALYWNGVNASSIDGLDIYWENGATASSDAVYLTGCTDCDLRFVCRGAPQRALRLNGCGDIRVSGDTVIRNASSQTGQNLEAVRVEGTLLGDITFNPGCSIIDTRGTPTHKYAIDASAATLSGHAVRMLQPVTLTGFTVGQTNGTITFVGGTASSLQTNVVRTSVNYQMQAADQMVVMTAACTVTLPQGLTSVYQPCAYVVKNGAASAGTVATGTTGKIENGISGITAATSETIAGGIGAANTYVPDTNLVSAFPNYDWLKA